MVNGKLHLLLLNHDYLTYIRNFICVSSIFTRRLAAQDMLPVAAIRSGEEGKAMTPPMAIAMP